MEENPNTNGILKEVKNGNGTNIPEGIGVAEDSGFASIAGSIVEFKDETDMSIGQNIKFRAMDDVDMDTNKGAKRKVKSVFIDEEKIKATEKYNQEKQEQTYKRLMHLLTKSQFYSKYIIDKINDTEKTKSQKKTRPNKVTKDKENDENNPPRQSHRARKPNTKYIMTNEVSSDIKKKLNDQNRKLNLSQEEIEAELSYNSDSEEKDQRKSEDKEFVQPKYFQGALRDYQIDGLQWLKVLYENGVNGILADEMGLGKTIQVIALYAHLLEKRQDGPYLIIAPLSTIPNWIMEFEKFAPQLPVVLYHGPQQTRAVAAKKIKRKYNIADGYKTYPIMLTTFEIPVVDKAFMASFKWRYIVVDEGHRIKNHECQLIKVLKRCDSMNRLLLTGTPLQNNLAELWSLLNFLLPEIFDDLAVFESWFDAKELEKDEGTQKLLKQEEEKQVLSTLREILKPFMLRRIKEDVCLDIPPKKELVVYAPLTELQYDLYRAVLNRDLVTLSKIEEQPLIIDDGPTRPKRRCVTRNFERTRHDSEGSYSAGSTTENDDNNYNSMWDASVNSSRFTMSQTATEKCLLEWGHYTDVTTRNRDFLVRLRLNNRLPMYRMIVNHPFLLHCPLDHSGLPEISENLVKASGKLLVIDKMLTKLKAQGHKVLLFSTSTMLLDLIADYLTLRPWRFVTLDGRHKIEVRQENIKSFNSDPEVFLFLISTRAGGVGLNLAAADTVIIYDSDWNPQMDLQAMARCHRIGQTRPVVVYRLCTKGTVDERMIARAEAKRKLEKMVISKKSTFESLDGLKVLKELLESTEQVVVRAENEVYTDAELDKILDRSDLTWKVADEPDSIEKADPRETNDF